MQNRIWIKYELWWNTLYYIKYYLTLFPENAMMQKDRVLLYIISTCTLTRMPGNIENVLIIACKTSKDGVMLVWHAERTFLSDHIKFNRTSRQAEYSARWMVKLGKHYWNDRVEHSMHETENRIKEHVISIAKISTWMHIDALVCLFDSLPMITRYKLWNKHINA